MARTLQVRIIGDAGSLARAFSSAGASAQGFGSKMNSAIGRAGKAAMLAVAAGATVAAAGIGYAAKSAVGFDRDMRNVNSIARLSEGQFQALEKQVLKIGPATGQSSKVLAAGLYDIVSSGFKANDAVKILAVTSKAATAGLTDTATSTKAITAALNAYHLGADSARGISDILFQTVNKGVLSFEELAQNMGDLVPIAAPLGVNLKEVGAAIATVTLQGVPAAEAATRVKNTMLALTKPSGDLKKLFKEQGYETGQAAVKALGYQGVLKMVDKATGGNLATLAKLFPEQRAMLGMLGLLGKNAKTYRDNLKSMDEAQKGAGATALAFAEQSKSVALQWDKAKASLEVAAIGIGTRFLPALTRGIQFAGKVINAGSIEVAAKIVWKGAQNAAGDLYGAVKKALLTHTETRAIEVGDGLVKFRQVKVEGLAPKIYDAVSTAIAGVDWNGVGATVADGISSGIKVGGKLALALVGAIDSAISGVDWGSQGVKLGPGFAAMLASAFASLMDPGFWAQHWELALAVGLSAFGGPIGKLAGKLAAPFLRMFERLGIDLALAIAAPFAYLGQRAELLALDAVMLAGRGLARGAALIGGLAKAAFDGAFRFIEGLAGGAGKIISWSVKVLGIEAAISAIARLGTEGFNKVKSWASDAVSAAGKFGSEAGASITRGFRAAVGELKRLGLEAALAIVEPFSHIKGFGGQWARNLKDDIGRQLSQIKADKVADQLKQTFKNMTPAVRAEAEKGAGAWVTAFDNAGKKIVQFVPLSAMEAGKKAVQSIVTAKAPMLQAGEAIGKGVGEGVGKSEGAAKTAGAKLGKGAADGTKTGMLPIVGNVTQKASEAAQAVGAQAANGYGQGFTLGSSIGSGVAAGLNSWLGQVQAAAAAISNAAIVHGAKAVEAASPSKKAARMIGKPIGQGIIVGFLEGTVDLPQKISDRLKNALEHGRQSVQDATSGWRDSLTRGSDDAFAAYDATTSSLVAAIDARFDRQTKATETHLARQSAAIDTQLGRQKQSITSHLAIVNADIDRWLASHVGQINSALARELAAADAQLAAAERRAAAKRAAKGPAEQELAKAENARAEQQQAEARAAAFEREAQALAALNAARAEGDPEKLAAAEREYATAVKARQDYERDQGIEALRVKAEAERQAREKSAAAEEEHAKKKNEAEHKRAEAAAERKRTAAQREADAARAKAERLANAARADAEREATAARVQAEKAAAELGRILKLSIEREKLELQARRDLKKRQLQDELDDLAEFLEKHPTKWKQAHTKVMSLFKTELGPDMAAAGKNLGKAFAEGLTESMDGIGSAAEKLAKKIADYLKLKSPAKTGPLSDLDTWWTAMPDTLTGGVDTSKLDRFWSQALGAPVTTPIRPAAGYGYGSGAGGGDLHVHVHVDTLIGSDLREAAHQLAEPIRTEILRTQGRNGGSSGFNP